MSYAIREIFDTLQGEGGRAGARSVFVRFAGCNYWNGRAEDREKGIGACARWCDTDFDAKRSMKMEAEEIADAVDRLWPTSSTSRERWVVLSGGEPLLQLDLALVRSLALRGVKAALETNGSTPLTPELASGLGWVCVSPKQRLREPGFGTLAIRSGSECKVVIPGTTNSDRSGAWTFEALEELRRSTNFEHYFLQPQDPIDHAAIDQTFLKGTLRTLPSKDPEQSYRANLDQCLAFIDASPTWRLSLQTHKYIALQ